MIPDKIKICGLTYKVKFEKKYRHMGCISIKDMTITIDDDMNKDVKELTLLHEITHGILNTIGEFRLSDNEKFIESFSSVLYQVLKDNKLVFDAD